MDRPDSKFPGERKTISAKRKRVYQTQRSQADGTGAIAESRDNQKGRARDTQIDKKRFGQRTLRRNNEYKKNVQLPESP